MGGEEEAERAVKGAESGAATWKKQLLATVVWIRWPMVIVVMVFLL